jgi:molecular chaperone GrpE
MVDPEREETKQDAATENGAAGNVNGLNQERSQISAEDIARGEVSELLEFVEDRVLRMRAYMVESSKTTDSDVKEIKKKSESKLAQDFLAVMKTFDDEVQKAAALNGEGSASLQSMVQGVAMINKVAQQAVEGIDLSAAANESNAGDKTAAQKTKKRGLAGMMQAAQKVSNPFTAVDTVYERISKTGEKLASMPENVQEELQEQLDNAKLSLEKLCAEYARVNERVAKEKENAQLFGAEKLVVKFADVVDNMDRAILAADNAQGDVTADEDLNNLYEGVKETKSLLLEAMKKNGVERDNPLGEKFNPNSHMAVSVRPKSGEEEANTVAEVMASGYSLNGRVVRNACVIVAQ